MQVSCESVGIAAGTEDPLCKQHYHSHRVNIHYVGSATVNTDCECLCGSCSYSKRELKSYCIGSAVKVVVNLLSKISAITDNAVHYSH